jgi:hypothetical protein
VGTVSNHGTVRHTPDCRLTRVRRPGHAYLEHMRALELKMCSHKWPGIRIPPRARNPDMLIGRIRTLMLQSVNTCSCGGLMGVSVLFRPCTTNSQSRVDTKRASSSVRQNSGLLDDGFSSARRHAHADCQRLAVLVQSILLLICLSQKTWCLAASRGRHPTCIGGRSISV